MRNRLLLETFSTQNSLFSFARDQKNKGSGVENVVMNWNVLINTS